MVGVPRGAAWLSFALAYHLFNVAVFLSAVLLAIFVGYILAENLGHN